MDLFISNNIYELRHEVHYKHPRRNLVYIDSTFNTTSKSILKCLNLSYVDEFHLADCGRFATLVCSVQRGKSCSSYDLKL